MGDTRLPEEFSDLRLRFNLEEIPLFKPRHNIAPTRPAPVITNLDGGNRLELFPAGLGPVGGQRCFDGNRIDQRRANP